MNSEQAAVLWRFVLLEPMENFMQLPDENLQLFKGLFWSLSEPEAVDLLKNRKAGLVECSLNVLFEFLQWNYDRIKEGKF